MFCTTRQTPCALGIDARSKSGLYGVGTSAPPSRCTGVFSAEKVASPTTLIGGTIHEITQHGLLCLFQALPIRNVGGDGKHFSDNGITAKKSVVGIK